MRAILILLLSGSMALAQSFTFKDLAFMAQEQAIDQCPQANWVEVIPPMVTDSTNGITLSASSIVGDPFHKLWSPVQGFVDGNGWMAVDATYPQYWQIQFASGVIGKQYLISIASGGSADFTDVIVAGSNNGSTWVNIQTNNIQHGAATYTNTIVNTSSYVYYRFTQDNWSGADAPQNATVNFIQMLGCQ